MLFVRHGRDIKGETMDCIYNTGGICYKGSQAKECPYIGYKHECEDAEES